MPSVDFISYSPAHVLIKDGAIVEQSFTRERLGQVVVHGFPCLSWSNGEDWSVANAWLASMVTRLDAEEMTQGSIVSMAYSLRTAMSFSEDKNIPWTHFPLERDERFLNRFRGWLIAARRKGLIAPTTAVTKMADVLKMYRWVNQIGLFDYPYDVFPDLTESVRLANRDGFERTMVDKLTIRNRKSERPMVEDGLEPLSLDGMNGVLMHSYNVNPPEIYLMLVIAFHTGMRIGTIADLKVQTIRNASLSISNDFYEIEVGPYVAGAPVATKFGVSGVIPIPSHVYSMIVSYIESPRRNVRLAKASGANRMLVFINSRGLSYCRKGGQSGSSVNAEMARLRMSAKVEGLNLKFKFHQARATYGTMYVAHSMGRGRDLMQVLGELKGIMLHRNESTTLTYVKFVQSVDAKSRFANDFLKESVRLQKKW